MKLVTLPENKDILILKDCVQNYRIYQIDNKNIGGQENKKCSGCCMCCKQLEEKSKNSVSNNAYRLTTDRTLENIVSRNDDYRYYEDNIDYYKQLRNNLNNFYIEYKEPSSKYNLNCSYCNNLQHTRKSLNNHNLASENFINNRHSIYVKSGNGDKQLINYSPEPDEELGINEADEHKNWKVWTSSIEGLKHTLISIDDYIIECVPKANFIHMVSMPSKETWLKQYHHAFATKVDEILYVAITKTNPHTHIWFNGVSIHIKEETNVYSTTTSQLGNSGNIQYTSNRWPFLPIVFDDFYSIDFPSNSYLRSTHFTDYRGRGDYIGIHVGCGFNNTKCKYRFDCCTGTCEYGRCVIHHEFFPRFVKTS